VDFCNSFGKEIKMNKAVFLDRDGVINPLVYNPNTGEYESPHCPEDFSIYSYVLKSLKLIKENNYKIIIVSNQPSYAKGKASMENILAIANMLKDWSDEHGVLIDKFYYCYHHPKGIVSEYTKICECRKPGILFLQQAKKQFDLDPAQCWFIGDRDTDIECGFKFGCRTVKVTSNYTLYDAANMILEETR
jgi:D-glycero-D-manno-heptose 1,7-bisphosphate phosphatase